MLKYHGVIESLIPFIIRTMFAIRAEYKLTLSDSIRVKNILSCLFAGSLTGYSSGRVGDLTGAQPDRIC